MTKLIFTVTNDITYDQRMDRICSSLAASDFEVSLIGKKNNKSLPLNKPYKTTRLNCFNTVGKFFYLEFNFRLFFFLLFKKFDIICANDLDTVLPAYWVAKLRNKKIVYDSHEYFTEMEEVVRRPKIQTIWKKIESLTVSHIPNAYTVNKSLADIFSKKFNTKYQIIRNVPVLNGTTKTSTNADKPYLIYSGAVNEGRGLEEIIRAMTQIDLPLLICGEGNKYVELQALVKELKLEDKIEFKGFVQPKNLKPLVSKAFIGFNLLTNNGKSYYYSLANKFFDYMHAEIPQITAKFPEYQLINSEFKIAQLIDLNTNEIVKTVNELIENTDLYNELVDNCRAAKKVYNWQNEEKSLVNFYRKLEKEQLV